MDHLIDERITNYIDRFYQPPDERLIPFRKAGELDRVPIIMKETESVLALLLDLQHPRRILEIGTAIGYSACFFALQAPEAEVWTIEKDEYAFQAARTNIGRIGLADRIHPFLGDGQEIIEKLQDEGTDGWDLVFIDAAKSHYRRFLDAALAASSDGALVVSDNIFQHGMTLSDDFDPKGKHRTNIGKMRSFVEWIFRDPHLQTALLPVGDGLAVSHYSLDPGLERQGAVEKA